MSLLGKIFTVFILLASFGLMIIAMFVYATHKNWAQDYATVKSSLQTAQTLNSTLETKYQNQISQLEAERQAAQQEVAKLSSELETVTHLNANMQTQVDQLTAQQRATTALVNATEDNNQRLFGEVQQLRGDIAQNQQARDEAFAKTLEATTNLHVTAGQLQTLRERSAQLVKQLSEAIARIREAGLDPEGPVVVQARGKITRTSRADGRQLIEISIGYDDGIRPGQTVEVFRGERYLGRATILRADPDVSVGQVLREFQQGQIQEQDDVATKLRVG
jgi:peptidoglycan hydrolase CwlO-like protein